MIELLKFIKSFFVDDTGASSMMRGIYFLCYVLVAAIVVVILILALHLQPTIIDNGGVRTVIPADTSVLKELAFLAFGILGIPTGGKFIQSFAERNVTSEKREVIP